MDELKFLTSQLNTSYKLLLKRDRHHFIVKNRWVAMLFLSMLGYNKCEIARIFKRDRSSVYNVLLKANNDVKMRAKKLYEIYTGTGEREKMLKIVPDYKHNKTFIKEVEI